MIYKATIGSTPLRLRESRIVAALLLKNVSEEDWRAQVIDQDVLQLGRRVTITRSANIIRARLQAMGSQIWEMVRDGDRPLATQAAFAGAVKHSRLLGDFMDLTIREQRALFSVQLNNPMWSDYIAGCRGRDPEMPHWSEGTINKLRSVVFSMLAEAGYLQDTKSLQLQTVFVDETLRSCLQDQDEKYVLRCLEVME